MIEGLRDSMEVRTILGNLPIGLWLASLLGSWVFAGWALVASLRGGRRLVFALRWGTVACVVQLMGLSAMVFVDNPERWKPLAWLVSLTPLGLALFAVVVASIRGNELPGAALKTPAERS
jgi:hypothetical protein